MPPNDRPPQRRRAFALAFCVVLAFGIFLRLPPNLFEQGGPLHLLAALHPNPAFTSTGFDESLYRGYVNSIIRGGLTSYPEIVDHYIEIQKTLPGSILPPMRFLYIFSSYLCVSATQRLLFNSNVSNWTRRALIRTMRRHDC